MSYLHTILGASAGGGGASIDTVQEVTAAGANAVSAWSSVVPVNATLGNQTITLPPANAGAVGKRVTFVRKDTTTNTVTISASGGDTLTAITTRLNGQGKALVFQCVAVNDIRQVSDADVDEVVSIANMAANGSIGTAAATVNIASRIAFSQTTSGITATLPDAAMRKTIPLENIGTADIAVGGSATGSDTITVPAGGVREMAWNGSAWRAVSPASSVAGARFSISPITAPGRTGATASNGFILLDGAAFPGESIVSNPSGMRTSTTELTIPRDGVYEVFIGFRPITGSETIDCTLNGVTQLRLYSQSAPNTLVESAKTSFAATAGQIVKFAISNGDTTLENLNIIVQQVSGLLPVAGVQANYMFGRKATAQNTGLETNGRVLFDTILDQSGGSVALDSTVNIGRITLRPGNSYHLKGTPQWVGFGGVNDWIAFCWYNVTTSTFFGNACTFDNINTNTNASDGGFAFATLRPTAETQVELRVYARSGGSPGANQIGDSGNSAMPWFEVEVKGGTPLAMTDYPKKTEAVLLNRGLANGGGVKADTFVTRFTGNFEFYEDVHLRFDHNGGLFRIAAVGTGKNIGVYGYNSVSTGGSFPVSADGGWQGGYSSIAVGVFTTISSESISSDYDDIQTYWIEVAQYPVKYRVTLQGGHSIGAIVERWDMNGIALNTKITVPD